MALLSPGIIGGLAAGFQGDQMLQELLAKKLQVQAGQRELQKGQEADKANGIWSKAIMDVLAANQQGAGAGVSPPIAPQPGQVSVPMTQGSAGVPAQAGPGAAPPDPSASAPAGAAAPSPVDPTLAVLGGGAAPAPAPAAPPPILPNNPMDASTILANIRADNPDMEPGVLSQIVSEHIVPLLSSQEQAKYKQFEQQLAVQKMQGEQQDRANELYYKYMALQQQKEQKGLDRESHEQIAAGQQAIMGELAALHSQTYADAAPQRAATLAQTQAQTAEAQQRVELIKAQTQKTMNAVPTGGAAIDKLKTQAGEIRDMTANAIRLIQKDRYVVGTPGVASRVWQAGAGWVDPNASTTASEFKQTILGIQDRINKMVSGGYMTAAKADRLNAQVQGLGLLDNDKTATASLTNIFNQMDDVYKNPSGAIGGTPSDTQVHPETGDAVTTGGSTAAPAASSYKSVNDLVKAVTAGTLTKEAAKKYAADHPDLPD